MKMKQTVVRVGIGVLTALGLAGFLLLQPGVAQTPVPNETPGGGTALRTVNTIGYGQVDVAPDQALVRLGVQTEGETASQALSENSERMQALLTSLSTAGVAPADIQTQNISLFPRYSDQGPGVVTPTQRIVGYTVSNIVQVRVRNLSNLGTLLDAAVNAGVNTIENVSLVVSDTSTWVDQARSNAFNDAEHRAQQLASLAGGHLGEVLNISEGSVAVPIIAARLPAAAMGGAVPVEPGSQTVSIQVQVTWQLLSGTITVTPTATTTALPTTTGVVITETATTEGTVTSTAIATGTETVGTATTTATALATSEGTETAVPGTSTATATEMVTETPTEMVTGTPTEVATEAATETPTEVATETATEAATATAEETSTPTPAATETTEPGTSTPTPTP
jgi:uncharacterized protein YggE